MRLEICGIVDKVNGIKPVKNGFSQVVILMQPAVKDDYDRVKKSEEYFVINIWSNKQTDSRFLTASKHVRSRMKALVTFKGERWYSDKSRDFQYNHKLNLQEWLA